MVRLPELREEKTGIQAPSGGSGAQAAGSAFNQLGAFFDDVGQTHLQARADEAATEGQGAVVRDEAGNLSVALRDPLTRSDIAYNRAAKTAYLARLSGDLRLKATELSNESQGNASAFETSYGAFQKETLKRIKKENPELEGPVTQLLEQNFSSFQAGILDREHSRQMKEFQNTIIAEIRARDDEMSALAAKGGTGTPEYAAAQADVAALYKELADNPQTALSQTEADLKIERMQARHQAEAVVGTVERIYAEQGLAAANKAIDDLFGNKDLKLSAQERRQYGGIARQRVSAIKAERKAELAPIQAEAGIMRDRIKNGGIYDDDAVDDTARALARLGDVKGSLKLLRTRAQARSLSEFRLMNDTQQREALAQATAASPNAPRGIRNNNPGNIEFGSFTEARGALGSDGRFARFASPEQGIAAMGDLLRSYQRRGLTTVAGMIGRWAPSSENDTGAYAKRVASAMGIGVNTTFDFAGNPDLAQKMVAAMIAHENGQQPFSHAQIAGGLGQVAAPGLNIQMSGPSSSKRQVDPTVVKQMRKEVASDAKRMLADIKKGIADGLAPGSDDLSALAHGVSLLGDQDLTAELTQSLDDLKALAPFSDLPPVQQQGELDAALATQARTGIDTDGIDRVNAMRQIHNRTVSQLDKDPIGLAIERGIPGIAELNQPIDFSNVEMLGEGLKQRQVMALRVGAYYGKPDVLPLRPNEVTVLDRVLTDATAGEKSQIFSALSENLSGKSYQQTIAALAGQKGSRVTAIAGALHQQNPQVGESVLRGQELLKEEQRLAPKEDDKNFGRRFDQNLPLGAFAPNMLAARSDFMDTMRARYADLSADASDTSGNLNADRMEQAIADVTGGVVTLNGEKLISPEYGAGQAQFDNLIEKLTDRDLQGAVFSTGVPLTAKNFRDHARLKSLGTGTYLVAFGRPGTQSFMLDRSGQPFVLDLKRFAAESTLRELDLGGT